jgi:hypothetical protein
LELRLHSFGGTGIERARQRGSGGEVRRDEIREEDEQKEGELVVEFEEGN